MAVILRDSTVVVAAVVRTRPRAIPLAMITMRKSMHGFPLVFSMGMGLRLATHLLCEPSKISVAQINNLVQQLLSLCFHTIKH